MLETILDLLGTVFSEYYYFRKMSYFFQVLARDRTRVEITLFLRRAQPARRDIWIRVEKTRRKYPNFEKMRQKFDGFFMGKMTSEAAIRAVIFHGHQTSYLFLFFSVWSAFFSFQTYFRHKKNVISRRVFDAKSEEKLCVGKNASASDAF